MISSLGYVRGAYDFGGPQPHLHGARPQHRAAAEEAALTRRIAEARARLAQRLVPAFDEAVFWEERAEWADDDPASLGDGADGRADPGSTVPRDA